MSIKVQSYSNSLKRPNVLQIIYGLITFLQLKSYSSSSGDHGVCSIDHSKDGCHLKIILIILKNVLTVDASEHHVVDACSALLPYLSGHIITCNIA